jgi:hypothetical protein
MALASGEYHYVMRIDTRSYYTSIQYCTLLKQLVQYYQDPRLPNYFKAIVGLAIDKGGILSFPQKDCQDAHPCPISLEPYTGSSV